MGDVHDLKTGRRLVSDLTSRLKFKNNENDEQNRLRTFYKNYHTIINCSFIVAIIGGVFLYLINKETYKDTYKLYNVKLMQYGDINKDDYITREEKIQFDKELFKNTNIILIEGEIPKYIDGTTIPNEQLYKLIKDYVPQVNLNKTNKDKFYERD